VGYTFSLKPNEKLQKAGEALLEFRKLIPELFNQGLSKSEIWADIDKRIHEKGLL
jgi:hypothetical protein